MRIGTKFISFSILIGLMLMTGGCGSKKDTSPKKLVSDEQTGNASQNSGCKDDLLDVFFISPATLPPVAVIAASNTEFKSTSAIGFAVGRANTILKTVDGGKSWHRMIERNEKGAEFTAVVFASENEGWALSRSLLLHTTDCGQTWSPVSKPPGNFYYFGPCAVTAKAYYQMQPPTCGISVHTTPDGGKTWGSMAGQLPRNDFECLFVLEEKNGWVAGNYGRFALTRDGGRTWVEQPIADGGHIVKMQFMSPQTGWLVANDLKDRLMMTADGGQSWTPRMEGIVSDRPILDMQFLDEQVGFLLIDAGKGKTHVMRTRNSGKSWELVETYPARLDALCFVDVDHGYGVGREGYIVCR